MAGEFDPLVRPPSDTALNWGAGTLFNTLSGLPQQIQQNQLRNALANVQLTNPDGSVNPSAYAQLAQALAQHGGNPNTIAELLTQAQTQQELTQAQRDAGAFAGTAPAPGAAPGAPGAAAPGAGVAQPGARAASAPSQYDQLYSAADQEFGLPAGTMKGMGWIESRNNPQAWTRGSSYKGLMQLGPDEAREQGANVWDAASSIKGAAQIAAGNQYAFRQVMGRDPTAAEIYLMHQQGRAGGIALISHPDLPAYKALMQGTRLSEAEARRHIAANGGNPDAPASQFAGKWATYYAGGLPSAQTAAVAPATRTQLDAEAAAAPRARGASQLDPQGNEIVVRSGGVPAGQTAGLAGKGTREEPYQVAAKDRDKVPANTWWVPKGRPGSEPRFNGDPTAAAAADRAPPASAATAERTRPPPSAGAVTPAAPAPAAGTTAPARTPSPPPAAAAEPPQIYDPATGTFRPASPDEAAGAAAIYNLQTGGGAGPAPAAPVAPAVPRGGPGPAAAMPIPPANVPLPARPVPTTAVAPGAMPVAPIGTAAALPPAQAPLPVAPPAPAPQAPVVPPPRAAADDEVEVPQLGHRAELPIDRSTGKRYTDWEKAVDDLRRVGERWSNSQSPQARNVGKNMLDKADLIEKTWAPQKLPGGEFYSPAKGVMFDPYTAAVEKVMTPKALDNAVMDRFITGKYPVAGKSIIADRVRAKVDNRMAELMDEAGVDGSKLPQIRQDFATGAAGARLLNTRAASLALAEGEAREFLPNVEATVAKLDRTRFTDLNSVIRLAETKAGSPEEVQAAIAIKSFVTAYARVLKPTGGVIGVTDMAHAADLLQPDWSKRQTGAAIAQFQTELASAKRGLADARETYNKTGRWSVPAGASKVEAMRIIAGLDQPAAPPPPAAGAAPAAGAPPSAPPSAGAGGGRVIHYDASGNRISQ